MPGAAGSLVVSLGLDAAEYTEGLTKAQYEAQRFRDQVAAMSLGTAIGQGIVEAAKMVGRALYDMTLGVIETADRMRDLSQKTGVTVETLGGLGFAASQAGGSMESAAQGMTFLNRAINQAAAGSKPLQEVFNKLGIEVKDASGQIRNADSVLIDIADKFQTFSDGPTKTAIAMRLLGRAGAEQISMLNEGGDAIRENIEYYQRFSGITTEVANESDKFNDTLGKLNVISGSLGRQLTAELIGPLNDIAAELLEVAENSDLTSIAASGLASIFKGLATGMSYVVETLAILGANVSFVLQGIGRSVGGMLAQMEALRKLDFKGFMAISSMIKEDSDRARAELDAFEKRVLQTGERVRNALSKQDDLYSGFAKTAASFGGGRTQAPAIGGSGGNSEKAKVTEAQRLVETLQKQLEKTQGLNIAEQTLLDIQKKRIEGLTPALEKQIIALSQQLARQQSQIQMEKEQLRWLQEGRKERERIDDENDRNAVQFARSLEALKANNEALATEIELLGRDELAQAAVRVARQQAIIDQKEMALAARLLVAEEDAYTESLRREIELLKEHQKLTGIRGDVAAGSPASAAEEAAKKFEDQQKRTSDTMADSIAQGIMDGFRRGETFADIFLQEIKAQFAKTVLSPIIKPIVDAGNALLANIFKSIGGAIIGGIGGGGSTPTTGDFARMDRMSGGGPVRAGGLYGVNELRTEGLTVNGQQFLLMGSQGGVIDSNPRMGGGMNFTQINNIGSNITRNEVAGALVMMKEQVKSEVARSMRLNGRFSTGG